MGLDKVTNRLNRVGELGEMDDQSVHPLVLIFAAAIIFTFSPPRKLNGGYIRSYTGIKHELVVLLQPHIEHKF